MLRVLAFKYISLFFFVSTIIINELYFIYDNFDLPDKYYLFLFGFCFIFQISLISDIIYIQKKSKTKDDIIIKSWKVLSLRNKVFIVLFFVLIICSGLLNYYSSMPDPAHKKFLYSTFFFGLFNKAYYSFYSSRQKLISEYRIDDDYIFLKNLIPPKEFFLGMLYTFIAIVILGIILFIYL